MNPIYIILGIAVVIGVTIVAKHFRRKWRTEALREAAVGMGLEFSPEMGATADFHGLAFTYHGRAHKYFNCIEGNTGATRVRIFDARYTYGSGKSRKTRYQTMIGFNSSDLDLPLFALRPESFFDRAATRLLGVQDIDLDDFPEFSRAFVLTGESEPAVRELMGDHGIVDAVVHKSPIWVEANGQQLVVYRRDRRIKPDDVRATFEEAFELFTTLADRSRALSKTRT